MNHLFINNPLSSSTSIDLNSTLGFEPMDYISCYGYQIPYCGQLHTLTWPGAWSDLPVVILLFGLYLYFVVLGAFATSDGGKPKYSWLMRSNSWGFCWLLFLNECIHHANATFMSKTELVVPGSSPFSRMFHHLIDGLCHTTFFLSVGCAYRSAGGKGLPSRALLIGIFFLRMIIEENWEYGGISYRLKYHEIEGHFDRPPMTLQNYLTPAIHMIDPRSHAGKLYWGYALSSLSAIAMISGIEPLLKLKASLIPQVLIILTLLFHPAAQMLIGGANVTPERSYAMHLGHLANYIAWQSNIFIWNIIGPDKHWISQYGGGSKSVKAA